MSHEDVVHHVLQLQSILVVIVGLPLYIQQVHRVNYDDRCLQSRRDLGVDSEAQELFTDGPVPVEQV